MSAQKQKRILLIQLNAAGDLLMTMPAIAAVVTYHPGIPVDIFILNSNIETVQLLNIPFGRIYYCASQSLPEIFRSFFRYYRILPSYSLCLDFTGTIYSAILSRLLSQRSGIPLAPGTTGFAIGFSRSPLVNGTSRLPDFSSLYHRAVAPIGSVTGNRGNLIVANLIHLTGITEASSDYRLTVPQVTVNAVSQRLKKISAADKPLLLVHPGAKWLPKQWPTAYWIELLTGLVAKNQYAIFFAAGPHEKKFSRIIQDAVPELLHVPTSMLELSALVSLADLVICLDSVAMHLAYGFRKKYIALFGPVSPRQSGYLHYPDGRHLQADMGCSPCQLYYSAATCERGINYCMRALKPDTVLAAVNELLSS